MSAERGSLFSHRTVRERSWPSASLKARIERRTKRGKDQWRYVIERDFVHTDRYHKVSRWRGDLAKTVALANRWLDRHDEDFGGADNTTEGYA